MTGTEVFWAVMLIVCLGLQFHRALKATRKNG